MPNLIALYLYYCSVEGISLDVLAASLSLPVEELKIRLEAARLCFHRQCRLEFTEPAPAFVPPTTGSRPGCAA